MTDNIPIEELDSALLHIAQLLTGRDPTEVAWWLCANHPKFVINHTNLNTDLIIAQAAKAGTPPKGNSWVTWFQRVKQLGLA